MQSLRNIVKWMSVFMIISLVLATSNIPSAAIRSAAPATSATGDAFADLVVGVPSEHNIDGTEIDDAGMIQVIYGLPQGLAPANNETFHQNMDFVEDLAEEGDEFGSALASGDFNGDGNYDVAVGVPFEDVMYNDSVVISAGAVHVFYGSETNGIAVTGDQFWHQGSLNIEGTPELSDHFGQTLAVGNFNGDAYDDLAIGVPLEDFEKTPEIVNAGAVNVIYGSASGLSAAAAEADQLWYQGKDGRIIDNAEDHDWFGFALAAGDFDNDGYDDLAIGAPGEDSLVKDDIGVVHVLYGTSTGLDEIGDQQWEQYDWGGSVESEAYDHFGKSLTAGKFRWLTYDALAIGVPDENIDSVTDAGAVNILYGSANGLDDAYVDFIYQDGGYIDETAEYLDQFGYSLAAVDFGGHGIHNLVVGVPYEDIDGVNNAGAVHVLTFATDHYYGANLRYFHQGRSNVPNALEANASFGFSFAPGDYNGDGKQDLAIGVPYDDCNASNDGAVVVIYDDVWGTLADYPPQYWCQGGYLVDLGETDDHFGLALAALPSSGSLQEKIYLPLLTNDD